MYSMTGYGTGRSPLGDGALLVEARSVNHRFLDIRVRLPSDIADHTHIAEAVVRGQLIRGRIDVTARLEMGPSHGARLDRVRARDALASLRALRDELDPEAPLPLSLLAVVPDLFSAPTKLDPRDVQPALEAATQHACKALWDMRAQEGGSLHVEIARLLEAARTETAAIAERIPDMVSEYRRKLSERVAALLEGQKATLDPARLAHEVAFFADRADVTEEIARLSSHFDQVQRVMAQDEVSIGRKLDFLLQELAREANTIGSKVADAEITLHVVELKAVCERMREQVQNVL